MVPTKVLDGDLRPLVSLDQAHSLTGQAIANYFKKIVSGS
jgi:hypothetical protein